MRVAAAVALAACVAVTACGGGDHRDGPNAARLSGDKKKVAAVVDDLVAAAHDGDTQRICRELFTSALAFAVAERAGRSCEAAVRRQLVAGREEITVKTVIVKRPQAHATVRELNGHLSRITFLAHGGRWRISGIR